MKKRINLIILTSTIPFIYGFSATSCSNIYKYPNYSLVCMGDSITYGYLPGGDQMALPYPKALQAKLGFEYSYNYGICGSTISNGDRSQNPMVNRMTNMPDRADILIFWGGVNDYSYSCELGSEGSTSSNTIYGALNNICQFIKSKYTESFVMFITPLPTTIQRPNYSLKDVRDAIIYSCNQYSIPVLDLYTSSGFEHEMTQSYSDGLHPTQTFILNNVVPQIFNFINEHN